MATTHREDCDSLATRPAPPWARRDLQARTRQTDRILAVASGGGHWAQLRAITTNLDVPVVYATTLAPSDVTDDPVHRIPDANASRPVDLARCAWVLWRIVRRERPDYLVTTGAAPGAAAVGIARLHGIPAIFIDSIANAEALSRSGRIAVRLGARTFTQWPHLSDIDGIEYAGTVFGEQA
ncbi:Oligosaccharide biosynthesis protein Alg14 like [Limimonas halophila]|uniref:Oligosaccharide biosynthesis protein Alg14 like n=1 Tax=Limimonas halophila TaxID=1082479 RepID=A0A1G7NLX0_9PROT|nr:hypothetical protein [Limimonas halophila]SDF74921.1 Oligosaccharide biosynthesis protein Alg14 like [Limimonas halophila]